MSDTRSRQTIAKSDLRRLARIAAQEREDFFKRHPEYGILYSRRVLCAALCGDSALHYINGATGVESFEVWTFYAEHPEAPFPHWHAAREDFGTARFGRLPDAPDTFKGRPVDLTGRSLEVSPLDDPIEALQLYLRRGATPSARELAEKAVILIEPDKLVGYVAWPTLAIPRRYG